MQYRKRFGLIWAIAHPYHYIKDNGRTGYRNPKSKMLSCLDNLLPEQICLLIIECKYLVQKVKGSHWKWDYDAILKGEKAWTESDIDKLKKITKEGA